MILEKQTQSTVLAEGAASQESIGMSLDLDSAQVLMQMLSKNLYSDAIGSTVRECASNALDSHRRAGVTDPIIVAMKINNQYNWEFSVEDFGLGLDADDVRNIISKYGKSTKRDSANELGMMGLGFKAPLAYCSSFYFVCRKNGMERKYMMYEGEDVNTIDMLYEQPTKERNGVKIIVPVSGRDSYSFKTKIKEQLAYFEKVYFDCADYINNDFQIIRHEHFQWSPLANDSYTHLCLDDVYYSLDFNKLGIETLHLPVALRFGLSDGIFPTPNRESIRYTKEAKEAILNKIRLVADYFVDKYNESVKECEDVSAVIEFYRNSSRKLNGFNHNTWDINELKKHTNKKFINPKLKGIDTLKTETIFDKKDYLMGEYEVKFRIHNNKMYSQSHRGNSFYYRDFDDNVYFYSEKISGLKKDYLKLINKGQRNVAIARKANKFKLGSYKQTGNGDQLLLRNLLSLDNYPKSKWRDVIEDFRKVVNMITKKWVDLDNLVVPQEFIDSRKKQRVQVLAAKGHMPKRRKLTGEVVGKKATSLERYVEGKSCKWVSHIIKMSEAHKLGVTVIYGGQEHEKTLDTWWRLLGLDQEKTVRLMVFSKRELGLLKDIQLHNWIHIDEFLKGKHILFSRVATAQLVQMLKKEYSWTFDKAKQLGNISREFYEKLRKLENYSDKYYFDDRDREAILKTAKEANQYDWTIYYDYLEMVKYLKRIPFINIVSYNLRWSSKDDMMSVIRDLFKYYGVKMDAHNYTEIKYKNEV